MQTTELITPPRAPSAAESLPDARRHVGDVVAETGPPIGAIAGYGPPVIALAGPWLLFVLALVGPFALVFTFVLLLVAATLLVLLAGTILASPYLLVRHVRRRRTGHVSVSSPALQLVPAHAQRVRA
jgi:hypothetical protein